MLNVYNVYNALQIALLDLPMSCQLWWCVAKGQGEKTKNSDGCIHRVFIIKWSVQVIPAVTPGKLAFQPGEAPTHKLPRKRYLEL
jgi:hypothetical protein